MSDRRSPPPGISPFQGAQDFDISGGQHSATGGDTYITYFGPVQQGSQSNQTVGTSPPPAHPTSDIADLEPSTSRTFPSIRLPNVSRMFQRIDTQVVDLLSTEFASQLNCSPGASRDSEIYLRHMLEHRHGFPIYRPEANQSCPIQYRRRGVSVGDVGIITTDGSFDFLFNVDAAIASEVNPLTLPKGFETIPHVFISPESGYFQPKSHLLSDGIEQTKESPITYRFALSEGAVLQLPQGATAFKAQNTNDFRDLASRHAKNWYEYLTTDRGMDVVNGSLCLVTACIKCDNWGTGVLYGRPAKGRDHLRFFHQDQPIRRIYDYWTLDPIIAKVGPRSTDFIAHEVSTLVGEPNQCVFLRGYKIALGESQWNKMTKRQKSSLGIFSRLSPRAPTKGPANERDSDNQSSSHNFTTSSDTPSMTGVSNQLQLLQYSDASPDPGQPGTESRDVLLGELCPVIPPLHPSDFVNTMMFQLLPAAQVALTHDDEWLDLLPEKFAIDLLHIKINDLLRSISYSYGVTVDQNDCVSLFRITVDINASEKPVSSVQVPRSPNTMTDSHRYYRTWLNKFCGKHRFGKPQWRYVDERVPPNNHIWTATVYINGTDNWTGQAGKKRDAMEIAAREALTGLRQRYG